MKIAYKHLVKYIYSSPSIDELSSKLFQLGHEHEIDNDIFDIEFTPNRGDCLSLVGLLRDLRPFYSINFDNKIYEKNIEPFQIKFKNNVRNQCPYISFLKIEVSDIKDTYEPYLNNYFEDLKVKKNNFFTDISNYLSYEIGQPTHCYDASKVSNDISLDLYQNEIDFKTLLGKNILLKEKNLVFLDHGKVINLAGVIGSLETACTQLTKSVIVESAYFNPEAIIGKSIKYDINSDAAYKFERGVDPQCNEYALRRFLNIVDEHASIKKVEFFSQQSMEYKPTKLEYNLDKIKKIIGTDISDDHLVEQLKKLGFKFNEKEIVVPSYRSDIVNQNDIAEEVARLIGYDNIPQKKIDLSFNQQNIECTKENKLKHILTRNGFHEVINYPFVSEKIDSSIEIDNPLDSSKKYLRTTLKDSLVSNLLFNERRQKDSIKLFEISDIYSSDTVKSKRILGIIASGRVAKNYKDFSKNIKNKYISSIFLDEIDDFDLNFIEIPRHDLKSKIKNYISYAEVELDKDIKFKKNDYKKNLNLDMRFTKYETISEYPSSFRDISFSIKDFSVFQEFEEFILNFKHHLLKEVYAFDYYHNEKMEEIKIGFRFRFQSNEGTITDKQINLAIKNLTDSIAKFNSVTIPGII